MSGFKVFITRPIPEEIVEKLAEECDIDMWHTSAILPPIAEKIPPLDGLMTYGHEPVSPEMIATAPNLKAISVVGVGYDHVHVEACRERGIAVGHTPGVLSDTTADMTMALLLAAARNIVPCLSTRPSLQELEILRPEYPLGHRCTSRNFRDHRDGQNWVCRRQARQSV